MSPDERAKAITWLVAKAVFYFFIGWPVIVPSLWLLEKTTTACVHVASWLEPLSPVSHALPLDEVDKTIHGRMR